MRHKRPLQLLGSAAIALAASSATAQEDTPRIAVFSGPTATIQNSPTLITSNKAREALGLDLMTEDGEPIVDPLYMQRLAAPVTLYVEQFSAHPLEADAADLYGPPDGYIDADGNFSEEQQSEDDVPVYEITLQPDDGLYPLPYMAMTREGMAWDGACLSPGAPAEECRQSFYPDASRIFEEIERLGGGIYAMADYDFYRPAPSGGYTQGLPEAERTDVGEGDIPPETIREDFFPYGANGAAPPRTQLALATNMVQEAMSTGDYDGGIWFEGSPNVEETIYWLSLLIDTEVPIVGNAAQRARGSISADGDANILDSIDYITSGVWQDADGVDRLGGVAIQAQQIFAAREFQKGDARPGGYVATGGHGGIIGNMSGPTITFIPNRLHTHSSEVNMSQLPESVMGVASTDDGVAMVEVPILDAEGYLVPSAIPSVTIVKASRWLADAPNEGAEVEIDILARIEASLADDPLAGFVSEGTAPWGGQIASIEGALEMAVMHGMPVVVTSRGNAEGFAGGGGLFIGGGNLTSTKARLLLMASMMKFGSLPLPADPASPTDEEIEAIEARIAEYQQVFDTH